MDCEVQHTHRLWMCIHNEKCNKPRHVKGYPGKVCSTFLYTETIKLYCMDTKTERTGKCKIPQNANGYPGKDKYKYQVWINWEVQYTHISKWVSRKRQVWISRLDWLGSAIYPYIYIYIWEWVSRKRQVRTLGLDWLGSATYPCMRMGIQEKARMLRLHWLGSAIYPCMRMGIRTGTRCQAKRQRAHSCESTMWSGELHIGWWWEVDIYSRHLEFSPATPNL